MENEMPCLKCGLSHKSNMTCNMAKHELMNMVEPLQSEAVPVTVVEQKEQKNETKVENETKLEQKEQNGTKVGRPCIGERPLTAAERKKRWLEKRRVKNACGDIIVT